MTIPSSPESRKPTESTGENAIGQPVVRADAKDKGERLSRVQVAAGVAVLCVLLVALYVATRGNDKSVASKHAANTSAPANPTESTATQGETTESGYPSVTLTADEARTFLQQEKTDPMANDTTMVPMMVTARDVIETLITNADGIRNDVDAGSIDDWSNIISESDPEARFVKASLRGIAQVLIDPTQEDNYSESRWPIDRQHFEALAAGAASLRIYAPTDVNQGDVQLDKKNNSKVVYSDSNYISDFENNGSTSGVMSFLIQTKEDRESGLPGQSITIQTGIYIEAVKSGDVSYKLLLTHVPQEQSK